MQLFPRETTEVTKVNRTRQEGQVRGRVRSNTSTLTKAKAKRFHNLVRNRISGAVTINLLRHKGEADILG
jgi:hypothetical protein